ncbi:hypothetical protein ALC53_12937 [Atta colombica]|uniref:Uncharacterized protein n=1 Tax=Atta colombica TaxID=520822 RepID=A0A151HYS6_9HYME|nr:hypothetical protein ALC53_12937 [Atta colombica]
MRHLTGSDITQINCPTGEECDYMRGGDALSISKTSEPPSWTILATVVSFRRERGELTNR